MLLPNNGNTLRGIRERSGAGLHTEIALNRPVQSAPPALSDSTSPRKNHVFVVNVTQIESESKAPASVRSGLELLSALYAVHPAFGEADILEIATSL